MSRSPAASARLLPAVMFRMTVWERFCVPTAQDGLERAPDLELVAVDGVRGGDAGDGGRHLRHGGAERARSRSLLVVETIRSALMALSTLLVAERDSDAPNTAMAETRASPTIRADDVWAVRRGLRMEFSRPSRPEMPSRRASGRPMTLAMGRATAGASMATPDEDQHRTEADQRDGRLASARRRAASDPDQR